MGRSFFVGNGFLLYNVILPTIKSPAYYVVALLLLLLFMSVSFVVATFHNLGDKDNADDA